MSMMGIDVVVFTCEICGLDGTGCQGKAAKVLANILARRMSRTTFSLTGTSTSLSLCAGTLANRSTRSLSCWRT